MGPPGGRRWLLPLLLAAVVFSAPGLAQQSSDDDFRAAVAALGDASFLDKEAIAERLLASGHASAGPVLTAMLEDRLFVRAGDQQVVMAGPDSADLPSVPLLDPVTLRDAGTAPAETLTRIGTNNRLRRFLRTTVARFALANPDPAVRLAAVRDMLRSLDEATVELLSQLAGTETDAAVKREIETGARPGRPGRRGSAGSSPRRRRRSRTG